MTERASVVIAGAGIAGISTAYQLSVVHGVSDVIVCDPRPPLTLTSDKSTECYRNWWPGPGAAMVELMDRSIDLMEEHARQSRNAFGLSRRGYLYVTADLDRLAAMHAQADSISSLGAGELRVHRGTPDDPPYRPSPVSGFDGAPGGADLFLSGECLRRHFPSITEAAVGGLHARRAGWVSAQQYGMWMLDQAREHGTELISRSVEAADVSDGRVTAVTVGDRSIRTDAFVNAAGPLLDSVARLVDESLPVTSEIHLKAAFADHLGVVPRHAPMVIWNDPQTIDWTPDERQGLIEAGREDLVGLLPPGCHARPEGGSDSPWVLGLWEYRRRVQEPTLPIPTDELYPEAVLRGLSRAIPGLESYRTGLPRTVVDGGYYTKTRENRPLIGPMRTGGCFVVGALSGFGVMAAAGAGDLAAHHVVGTGLPDYASAFSPDRYDDPDYVRLMATQGDTGQL